MNNLWLLLVLGVLFINSCAAPNQDLPVNISDNNSQNSAECIIDVDCGVGGCSGQVCASKDTVSTLITTCEYLPEYDCFKQTSCGCVEGKCLWKETPAYADCLEKLK